MMSLCCINFIVPCKTLTQQKSELVNESHVFILIREMKFVIQMRKVNELNAQAEKNVVMCQFGLPMDASKHSH